LTTGAGIIQLIVFILWNKNTQNFARNLEIQQRWMQQPWEVARGLNQEWMATGNVKNAKTLTFHDGEQQRQIVCNNNKTFWSASLPIFLPLHIFCCGGESDDKSARVLLFCNLCAIFSPACLQIAISYRIWDFQWLMDSQCCELICRVVDWWDNRTNCFQCHKRRGLKGDDIVRKYVRSLIEDPSSSSNNIRNWEQPPPPTTPRSFLSIVCFLPKLLN
jgi:hypothetical protein